MEIKARLLYVVATTFIVLLLISSGHCRPDAERLRCRVTTCDIDPESCARASEGQFSERSETSEKLLEKRVGKPRKYDFRLLNKKQIEMESRSYPQWKEYAKALVDKRKGPFAKPVFFQLKSNVCGSPALGKIELLKPFNQPQNSSMEHVIPANFLPRSMQMANHGRLLTPQDMKAKTADRRPTGSKTRAPRISSSYFENVWQNPLALPSNAPPVSPISPKIQEPEKYAFEVLGSLTNVEPFLVVRDAINTMKGSIADCTSPMDKRKFERYVKAALRGGDKKLDISDEEAIQHFMAPLREVVAVFEYLQHPMVAKLLADEFAKMSEYMGIIERNTRDGEGLQAQWDETYYHWFPNCSKEARKWVTNAIEYIRQQYADPFAPYKASVMVELRHIEKQVPNMKYPFEKRWSAIPLRNGNGNWLAQEPGGFDFDSLNVSVSIAF